MSNYVRYPVPATVRPAFQRPISQIIASLEPAAPAGTTLSPGSLDRTTRALGGPTVNPRLAPAGLAHTRTLGSPTVSPQLRPAGLAHTRAQGSPTVSAKVQPAGLSHTRTLGSPTVSPQAKPAGLAHTRAQGAPAVSPQLLPSGQTHTRALGDPTVGFILPIPDVTAAGRTRGVLQATVPTPTAPEPGVPQVITGLDTPAASTTLSPSGLGHTRALGDPTVSTTGVAPIPDVIAAGGTKGVIRAVRPIPVVESVPIGPQVLAYGPAITGVAPAGLTRTRALGAPTVSPQTKPTGLAHTRALGSTTVARQAVRQLGNLTVTAAWVPRPVGLQHGRTVGAPVAHGRATLTPEALTRARQQGTPTLSGRTTPAGLTRTRALGQPSVNARTLAPASLTRTRTFSANTITIAWIPRPVSLTHARNVGTPVTNGRQTVAPATLLHTRQQGTPQLSGRTTPAGLVHGRQIGVAAVNVRTVGILALDRA